MCTHAHTHMHTRTHTHTHAHKHTENRISQIHRARTYHVHTRMHTHTRACITHPYLLTPPPPPPHTIVHLTHNCHTSHKQTNIQEITPHRYIAQAHMHVHTYACTSTHEHLPPHPHPTQYICNHEGMIIFPIRYSNIATQKCS